MKGRRRGRLRRGGGADRAGKISRIRKVIRGGASVNFPRRADPPEPPDAPRSPRSDLPLPSGAGPLCVQALPDLPGTLGPALARTSAEATPRRMSWISQFPAHGLVAAPRRKLEREGEGDREVAQVEAPGREPPAPALVVGVGPVRGIPERATATATESFQLRIMPRR
jgi:hypothetical protein